MREFGVADLRYERLNMQIMETSIHNAAGFSTDFFHTLIKQRRESFIKSDIDARELKRAIAVSIAEINLPTTAP